MRAMVINGKIQTTKAKAKAIQGSIEGLITLGKKSGIPARRKLYSVLGNDRVTTDFIIEKVVPAFASKESGFTRITNLPRRTGDNSQMVRLEWSLEVEKLLSAKEKKTKGKVDDKNAKGKKEEGKKPKGNIAKLAKALRKK